VGIASEGILCGEQGHKAEALNHEGGLSEPDAAEDTNVRGDERSSPVVVSGSSSSAELASTGVGGWEIVHSDFTAEALQAHGHA